MQTAPFSEELQPFLAMEVMERGLERATQPGADVVQLCVGEPDFDAPPEVVDEAVRALRAEDHYTESRGLHALCSAIAATARSDAASRNRPGARDRDERYVARAVHGDAALARAR